MASETDTRDLLQSNNSEDEIRAYCPDCHVNLEITCEVDISYHSPRVDPPPPSVQDDFKSDEFSLKLF